MSTSVGGGSAYTSRKLSKYYVNLYQKKEMSMPNDIAVGNQVFTHSEITTSNMISIAQEVLSSLGLEDKRSAMQEANQQYQSSRSTLLNTVKAYEEKPDIGNAENLIKILESEIETISTELSFVKIKQMEYQKAAGKETKNSNNWSYARQILNWIYRESKQFFGSDNASLAKHYEEIAKNREVQLQALKQYNNLVKNNVKIQHDNQTILPPQFPATVSLATLNGKNGFKLIGENAGDMSGISISSAGDVNGDGKDDLIIGALKANNNTGASYLIFGQEGPWSTPIALSNLNGTNGVKFIGENAGDMSDSVRSAGDVNKDGIGDFLIGAWGANGSAGVTYLIFGQRGPWTSPIALSNLGVKGVKFTGENANDNSGISVSTAGDVDGDEIDDLIIGAQEGNGGTGATYLIFGHTGPWASSIALSNLNGTNGVKFIGENIGDQCGYSVSSAGDMNEDGKADFIIGAYGANTYAGSSYLIFGHSRPWTSPMALSSLTGVNGVKFIGESTFNYAGLSVNSAGDATGDGRADLIIGAFGFNNGAGASYLVFGDPGPWTSPIALSSLTGVNGVKFIGQNSNDHSGYSVSSAGDVDKNGVADLLIGAQGANGNTGASYLVLMHTGAWTSPIALSSLTGTNGVKFNGETANDHSGYSVSSTGDIDKNGIVDFIIGAYTANNDAGVSYVIFGDDPALFQNQLTIVEGSSQILNNTYLSAVTGNTKPLQTQFNITQVLHGHFELINQPGQSINNFTQQMINHEQIRFVHDGSCFAPSYQVSVFDGGLAFPSVPQSAAITFLPIIPSIITNYMILNSGQTIVLGSNNLNVTDPGDTASNLHYTISSLIHGQFSTINNPFVPITQFTQQQINNGVIQFVSDTSGIRPSYLASVQDICGLTSSLSASNVNFYELPSVGNNQLTISEGQRVLLTSDNLNSTSPNGIGPFGLTLTISNLKRGHFELFSQPGQALTHFTQQQVNSLVLRFVHDGSCGSPSYQVSVFDGGPAAPSLPVDAVVTFNSINPVIIRNALYAIPGQGVVLDVTNLNSTDPGDEFFNLQYTVISVQHGQFSRVNNPTISISQFSQQQVNDGIVQFTSDNSGIAPNYLLSVQDSCGLASDISIANISFHQLPTLGNNQLTINQGQSLIVTSDNLNAKDMNDITRSSILQFLVSNAQHGYFEIVNNPGTVINNFYQENVSTGVVQFTHDGSVQAPSYSTSVSDGLVSTNPSPALINFTLNNPPDNTVRNAIIGASVSGAVGLLFFGLRFYLAKKADAYLAKEADEYNKRYNEAVIFPIAKEISVNIKIAGCTGYVSETTSQKLLDAVFALVKQLESKGIAVERLMSKAGWERSHLLRQIVRQTRKILFGEEVCCSWFSFTSLCWAETTPEVIEDKAKEIAEVVENKLKPINESAAVIAIGSDAEPPIDRKVSKASGSMGSAIPATQNNSSIRMPLLTAYQSRLNARNEMTELHSSQRIRAKSAS